MTHAPLLAVIGLGYVGLPLTAEFGQHQPVLADLKSLYDRHAAAAAGFTVFRL